TLVAAACSCCCCCCIHSVGGLAGAIYGGFRGRPPATEGASEEAASGERLERKAADRTAIKVYWCANLIIALITIFVTGLVNGSDHLLNSLGTGLAIVAFGLPVGQLAASVLSLIYLNAVPPLRKQDCLRRLGRITLFAFTWGLIGSILTWILVASINW